MAQQSPPKVIGAQTGPVYHLIPGESLDVLFDHFTNNREAVVRIYQAGRRGRTYRVDGPGLRTIILDFLTSVSKYRLLERIPKRFRTDVSLIGTSGREYAVKESPFAIEVIQN